MLGTPPDQVSGTSRVPGENSGTPEMDLAVKQLIEATGFDLGNLDTLESHSMTVSTPEVSADSMEALSTNLAVGALAPVLVVLDRFTLFTSFPFELRLKIWNRISESYGRVVHISGHVVAEKPDHSMGSPPVGLSIQVSSIATLLCINRETRNEFIGRYKTPFTSNMLTPSTINTCLPDKVIQPRTSRFATDIRINFDLDTLLLQNNSGYESNVERGPFGSLFLSLFGEDEKLVRKEIKYLTVCSNDCDDLQVRYMFESVENLRRYYSPQSVTPKNPPKPFCGFVDLKEFGVVVDDPTRSWKVVGFHDVAPDKTHHWLPWAKEAVRSAGNEEPIKLRVVAAEKMYTKHKPLLAAVLKAKADGLVENGQYKDEAWKSLRECNKARR